MGDKVTITVNGQKHEVQGGGWLIDTLNELGCEIPHFCYHPGLGPDGNCRMCQVEFVTERGGRLAISCNARVTDGLNVNTTSEVVLKARAAVEEMLLLNHPLDCPICDKAGECTLQNYYMDHDMKDTRQTMTRFKKDKALDIGPTLVLAGRGHEAFLTPFPGKPVDNPYSLNTYDLCPVGALTSKDFRFSIPTWFLKRTPSVCNTCARGCSMTIDSHKEQIHRLRPRYNADVNGHWMCDEGRLNYKFVNEDRIKRAFIDRDGRKIESSIENGMLEAKTVLGLGGDAMPELVILASASCTLEEMYALKMLAAAHPNASLKVARHVPDGVQDELLRRADRHANARGAELLGIDIIDLRDGDGTSVDAPEGAVLLVVGFDTDVSDALLAAAGAFTKVVVISARNTELTKLAHLTLPGFTFAEKDGLIVNFEGQVQAIVPALDNLWDRQSAWELIADLTEAAGGEKAFESLALLRSAIAEGAAPFNGVNLNAVGTTGVRLQGQAV
jgi:NADH-quinone oxidoreductase subunit G